MKAVYHFARHICRAHGDAASSRVTPKLRRTSAALPGGPLLRNGPCEAESEGIPLPYSTPRHLLQYVTGRAAANGITKLRRFTKRLRYRCGRCFANFNHPFQTRDDRACRSRHEDAEGAQRAQCPNGSAPAVARPPRPCAIHAKTGARRQTLRANYVRVESTPTP